MGSETSPARGMTVNEAAAWLRTNPKQVRKLIHHRELPAIRLGKSYVIDRLDLEAWWARKKAR
jgi:excisionase family DNA binding protein